MWKSTDKPAPTAAPATSPNIPATPPMARPTMDTKPMETYRADVAHIGKSVLVRGELSGSEDLYLDGEVEGSIELRDHALTIGPNGRIRANVVARDVVVHGKVDGNIHSTEKVELKKSSVLVGDISTQRIVIEDGAFFKGAIDIRKDAKAETPKPQAKAMAAAASYGDTPLLDEKKF
jgi:cytoskeletal protein CcmA (bactofilin family)